MKRLNRFAEEHCVPTLGAIVGSDGSVELMVERKDEVLHSFRIGRRDAAKIALALQAPGSVCIMWPELEIALPKARRKSAAPRGRKASRSQ